MTDVPTTRADQVRAAAATWRSQLIDLGGRNQLLYYRDLSVGTLELDTSDPVAAAQLEKGRKTTIRSLYAESRHADVTKRARTIRNKAVEAAEERGIQVCFAAFGLASWRTEDGKTPRAPVLLRPATLTPVGAAQTDFTLQLDEEVQVNPILVHFLRRELDLTVEPEALLALLTPERFDPRPVFDRLTQLAAGVPDFIVERTRLLGTFSFAKLPMVTDLESNAEALLAHDVVAAVSGNREARRALMVDTERVEPTDPDRRPPADEFLVLDADSSQSYAINTVLAGQSVVISGPPGTGKSQTIANLVASLIGHGRSVLFVAEKRAAITAVLDRLDRVGMADLVFDLHDTVRSRRAIAESLATALHAAATIGRPDQRELHERLVRRRVALNAHDLAMHREREPWGISLFEAQCGLIELESRYGAAAETTVRLRGSELVGLDAVARRRFAEELSEYASLGGLTLTRQDSPWVGASIRTPQQAEHALATASRLTSRTAPDTRVTLDRLLAEAGLARPRTLAQWSQVWDLLDGVAASAQLIDLSVQESDLGLMIIATAMGAWRKAHRDPAAPTEGWWARRGRVKQARTFWRGPGRASKAQLHDALIGVSELGRRWERYAVDRRRPRALAAAAEAKGRFDQLKSELASLGGVVAGITFDELDQKSLQQTLDALAADTRTLRKLPRLNELAEGFRRAGLQPLVDDLARRRLDPELARATFQSCWLRSVVDRAGFDDEAVATFDGDRHDATVDDFRAADVTHLEQAARRVRRLAAERLVAIRDRFPEQSQLVEAQSQRKRGHLPLRELFTQAPDVMTALKPCWAMSPLLVSQLLPGQRPYFDVVVFDEASQVQPADAVPAILRGRQLVVAGDNKQLPPTSFFAAATDGETDEEVVAEDGTINLALTSGFESILDVMKAGLGPGRDRSLTWHYRSRDERLIAFSNATIYDGSLTTFPGVIGEGSLSHVLVQQSAVVAGQEDSVTSEVERVVALIIEHAEQRPHESLGVITMGIKHADRVNAALRGRVLGLSASVQRFFDETAEERFFVKNLERVQGDERDAIILSIGYGKSGDGRMIYRFGPLGQEGGHRRLNVAVTRARSRMTLVSSFSHHDMDPGRVSAEGVKMLRAYLQFADSHGTSLGDRAMIKPVLNPFEISVRDRLVAAGIPLVTQYGVAGYWIDFAAQHPRRPGQMVLAVEADGATYHSSPTARDRDRLRQEQLERLGWTFHRIWSTDWFTDADTCVKRTKIAYEHAVAAADAADVSESARRDRVVVEAAEPEVATVPGPPAVESVLRGARPETFPGTPITEYPDQRLIALIRWIESDERLRTADDLFDEFVRELGFQRRGHRIRAAFDRVLPRARARR